jgi:uncharacterized protein
MPISLFIDGDAFPNVLKPILVRAIKRHSLPTFVISNKPIDIGKSNHIHYIVVDLGPDEADHRIVEMVREGDLVITADIPLADRVITKNAYAIDQRGELFSEDNIKEYLAMRDLMQKLRDRGERTKGPAAYSKKHAHEFANQLDKHLIKLNAL